MTWTQDGVNYVCQKYGDINECVVSAGLVFDFIDDLGNPFTGMTGSTADIVSLVAFGLASSITMTTPSRSTIINPETELDNANRGTVTQLDAMELIDHDERSAYQWCYLAECSPDGSTKCEGFDLYTCVNGRWALTETNSEQCGYVPPECEPDGTTKCVGYDLYTCQNGVWVLTEVNSPSCGYVPPECSDYTNQTDCEANNCYWYNNSCHSNPQEIPWLLYVGIATVVVGGIAVAIKRWR